MKKLIFTIALLIAEIVSYAGSDEAFVYPNPAQDQIYVQIPDSITGITELSVIDMNGRIVYQLERNLDANEFRQTMIPVTGLSNGEYLLRITNNEQLVQTRFIKN